MAGPVDFMPAPSIVRHAGPRPAARADNDNDSDNDSDNGSGHGADRLDTRPALVAAAIALAGGRRTAVTLRLDAARHMRLRLACALGGRSAQAIATDALDDFLRRMPGIERLIADAMAEGGDQAATLRGFEI